MFRPHSLFFLSSEGMPRRRIVLSTSRGKPLTPFRFLAPFALFVATITASASFSAEVSVERSDKGAVVKIEGQLFTEYLIQSGNKPILWPIIGPTGKPMTRAYPMRNTGNEASDHPHQESLWFAHGNVNGVNFWSEPRSFPPGYEQVGCDSTRQVREGRQRKAGRHCDPKQLAWSRRQENLRRRADAAFRRRRQCPLD